MAIGWGSERDGNSSLSSDESGHVTPQLRTLQWLPSHTEWKLKSSQWATRMKKSVQHIPTLALLPQWIPLSCLPASSLYLTHSNILLFSNIPGMSLTLQFLFLFCPDTSMVHTRAFFKSFFKYHLFSEASHRHPTKHSNLCDSILSFLLITHHFLIYGIE